MAKYSEGTYLIVTFDKYGTKIETRIAGDQSLTGAQSEAQQLLDEHVASYAVMRVLTNSIDSNSAQRWLGR